MTNTSTKRVRYFWHPENYNEPEMLWAVDPNKDRAWYWNNGWKESGIRDGVLGWFLRQESKQEVFLYQVQHMGKVKAPKNL